MIPEDINLQAEESAKNYVDTELANYNNRYKEAGFKDFKAGYLCYYCRSEIESKEITRLKGLIEKAHDWGAKEFSEGSTITIEQSFKEFKESNQL